MFEIAIAEGKWQSKLTWAASTANHDIINR